MGPRGLGAPGRHVRPAIRPAPRTITAVPGAAARVGSPGGAACLVFVQAARSSPRCLASPTTALHCGQGDLPSRTGFCTDGDAPWWRAGSARHMCWKVQMLRGAELLRVTGPRTNRRGPGARRGCLPRVLTGVSTGTPKGLAARWFLACTYRADVDEVRSINSASPDSWKAIPSLSATAPLQAAFRGIPAHSCASSRCRHGPAARATPGGASSACERKQVRHGENGERSQSEELQQHP